MGVTSEYYEKFEERYEWGRKFDIQAAVLVGPYLHRHSTIKEDKEEGIDVWHMYPKLSHRAVAYYEKYGCMQRKYYTRPTTKEGDIFISCDYRDYPDDILIATSFGGDEHEDG